MSEIIKTPQTPQATTPPKFPTEIVDLPSKGRIYSKSHPLSSGKVEMKYMTAREEDILTNQSYIEKGIVLDKLMESLTMHKFDIADIHTGDKNAIFIAARVLGYGSEYKFTYDDKEYEVDLSKIENKPFNTDSLTDEGYDVFEMPTNGAKVEFKHLTEKDIDVIEKEILGISKLNKGAAPEITTKLKHQIISVNGDKNRNEIRNYVDNFLLARDSRAFRNHVKDIAPDVNLSFTTDKGVEITIPITVNFFWPDL
tara:strand:+ start:34 stop:795 length:762 start_codon:yes stop_codon:yes gene_type:complete